VPGALLVTNQPLGHDGILLLRDGLVSANPPFARKKRRMGHPILIGCTRVGHPPRQTQHAVPELPSSSTASLLHLRVCGSVKRLQRQCVNDVMELNSEGPGAPAYPIARSTFVLCCVIYNLGANDASDFASGVLQIRQCSVRAQNIVAPHSHQLLSASASCLFRTHYTTRSLLFRLGRIQFGCFPCMEFYSYAPLIR